MQCDHSLESHFTILSSDDVCVLDIELNEILGARILGHITYFIYGTCFIYKGTHHCRTT